MNLLGSATLGMTHEGSNCRHLAADHDTHRRSSQAKPIESALRLGNEAISPVLGYLFSLSVTGQSRGNVSGRASAVCIPLSGNEMSIARFFLP